MNKKFSTLVASVLLAGAVGTVTAAESFVKFSDKGEVAKTVKQRGGYQLADNTGRVLALMRSTLKDGSYEYTLQMVSTGHGANLAETLWNITYTENKEGGPSFTFTSAAYGIPLSFTPNNVDARELIHEYPGAEVVWKWQKSTEVTSPNKFAYLPLVNNYSSALDSAIVVVEDINGAVAAKRYKTSEGTNSFEASILKLTPVVASQVVLGADDLNSMMMTQAANKDGKGNQFKLTFNDDAKNPEFTNLWINGKLTAVEALAASSSMFEDGVKEGDDYVYNENQRAAAKAAQDAVDALNIPATIANVIKPEESWENDVQAWAKALKEEAAGAEDLQAALKIVETALAEKTAASEKVEALKAVANSLSEAVTAFEMNAQNGENHSKSAFNVSIKNSATAKKITNKSLINAFQAAVPEIDNTQESFDAALVSMAEYAKTYNVTIPSTVENNKKAVLTYLAGKLSTDTELRKVYKAAVNGTEKNFKTAVNKVNTDAKTLAAEVAKYTFTENKAAWDLDKFKDQFMALSYSDADAYSEAQFMAVKSEVTAALDEYTKTVTDATLAQAFVQDFTDVYPKGAEETTAYDEAVEAITTSLNTVNNGTYVQNVVNKLKDNFNAEGDAILAEISKSVKGESIVDAIASVDTKTFFTHKYENITNVNKEGWLSLSLNQQDAKKRDLYLAVDTNFVTVNAGRRHLTFGAWYYNADIKNSKGKMLRSANKALFNDYNGHFNFKFTYFPTQDSLVIVTDGYAMQATTDKNWVDIENPEATYKYEGNGNTVMLAVLAKDHSEATVGIPQTVSGTKNKTLNTRIGFNANVAQGAVIPAGVYTIQYISNDANKQNDNGRYIVANWLPEGQALAKVEDQNLNHIPAAQWMLSHENGTNINTIVNRESGENLYYYQNNAYVPVQYLYSTATENLYTTVYGDSLKLAQVDAESLKDAKLGYYAAAEFNEETGDQLNIYALQYLNQLADVFVNYTEKDSILNVTVSETPEVYFRLIPAAKAAKYGASNKDLAVDLTRQAYYLRLETGKANVKDEDQLWITKTPEGKYKLATLSEAARSSFFLKEFKEADTHSYALVEADNKGNLGTQKISVKDYPSILISEMLEGEMKGYYGWYLDGRTSTFMLTAKDAPKYRRLNVTDENDGLKDKDTNYAKFYTTRNTNRYLYENTANKVAGYDENPLGLNFLGDINVKEATKNLAIFVDTAYIRNNTQRPQYMLALRPEFVPDTIPCEAHPDSHPYDLIDAVHADYLVTLADSVAAYTKKTTQNKFRFDGYTRLAFVPAKHVGDQFIIKNSVLPEAKNTIDLSKNAFVEGAWQFRLTGNEGAEFYIEGAKANNFIRLVNGVAVVTEDITDAERFNIESTDEAPTANEAVAASEISVVATNGAIIVKGAAGKKVAVSNILGQTIANTVVASDSETIAAPAGIAVVAVEGEEAVKVVVK